MASTQEILNNDYNKNDNDDRQIKITSKSSYKSSLAIRQMSMEYHPAQPPIGQEVEQV